MGSLYTKSASAQDLDNAIATLSARNTSGTQSNTESTPEKKSKPRKSTKRALNDPYSGGGASDLEAILNAIEQGRTTGDSTETDSDTVAGKPDGQGAADLDAILNVIAGNIQAENGRAKQSSGSDAAATAGGKSDAAPVTESTPAPGTAPAAVAEEQVEQADQNDRKEHTTAFDNLGRVGIVLNALVDALRGVDVSEKDGDQTPDAIQGYTEPAANSTSQGQTWYQTADSDEGTQVYAHGARYPGGYYSLDPDETLYNHGKKGATYQSN